MKYSGEFLWGLTEAEYHTLKDVKPKAMKVINTSEGVRYICQFTACDGEFTSATGAVLHEAEHQGQKLIASQGDEDFTPPELVLAEHLRAQQKAQEQQALARERGEKIQDVIDSGAQKEQDNKSQKAFRTAQRQVV